MSSHCAYKAYPRKPAGVAHLGAPGATCGGRCIRAGASFAARLAACRGSSTAGKRPPANDGGTRTVNIYDPDRSPRSAGPSHSNAARIGGAAACETALCRACQVLGGGCRTARKRLQPPQGSRDLRQLFAEGPSATTRLATGVAVCPPGLPPSCCVQCPPNHCARSLPPSTHALASKLASFQTAILPCGYKSHQGSALQVCSGLSAPSFCDLSACCGALQVAITMHGPSGKRRPPPRKDRSGARRMTATPRPPSPAKVRRGLPPIPAGARGHCSIETQRAVPARPA